MNSNQSNLMYLPPSKVIAAGTNRNNLVQAGLPGRTLEQEIDERIDYLTYKIDKLIQADNNSKQAGVTKQVSLEEQRNLKIAGILNSTTEAEKTETMLKFMNGEISMEYLPWSTVEANRQKQQDKNIKQAGTKASEIEMLRTFAEFGGLL